MKTMSNDELKSEILRLTREYSKRVHASNRPAYDNSDLEFVTGSTTVPYAGRVFDEDEVEAAVSSALDFWLTLGPEGEKFERGLAEFLGVRSSVLCNSGSSANLLAVSALTSHKLPQKKRLLPGDEVITAASGFPTTVAPILQNGLTAVFIDVDPKTGNARSEQLEDAYVPGKTKAVMMAHALGNPFDISTTLQFCKKNDLWLIEDNCDALGSTYTIPRDHALQKHFPKAVRNQDGSLTKPTGSWGDLSSQSFYPPHHITMGEGGAVNIVNDIKLRTLVESFRDWGRDCWCPSGVSGTCNKRFGWNLGQLPDGYDHKYIYTHLGYNLKPMDFQAAIGLQQLQKLDRFNAARRENWHRLREGLKASSNWLDFQIPTHAKEDYASREFQWEISGVRTNPAWFGFGIRVKPNPMFSRNDLATALGRSQIDCRMLFGGNLVKQPAFIEVAKTKPEAIRSLNQLEGADDIMNNFLFVGVYPGLTTQMNEHISSVINSFVQSKVIMVAGELVP